VEQAAEASEVAAGLKAVQNHAFDHLNARIAAAPYARHVRFLNFGYVATGGDDDDGSPGAAAVAALGRAFPNPESARLLHEVVRGAGLGAGDRAVEVGCGRGGNLWLLRRWGHRGPLVGLDLSLGAVRSCRAAYPDDGFAFARADAERLPLATAGVDAVLSVESSCTYPDVWAFLGEVTRVLRPGGTFCYTDLFDRAVLDEVVGALGRGGFALEHDRDITANVVASRAQRARRQQRALGDDEPVVREYVGAPGSGFGALLADRGSCYRILHLRRDARPWSEARWPALATPSLRDGARRLALRTAELLRTGAAPAR
jgi:SAM-dependent methyltransferase